MVYTDKMIKDLISENVITNADESCITNIAYDLRTYKFYSGNSDKDECSLAPMESIFVGSTEQIHLRNDMIAKVYLRNKRIRQGLALDAPVYQPGHETRVFFRITNISDKNINLSNKDGLASIMFEKLPEEVEKPYGGKSQTEFNFRGIAGYADVLKDEIETIEKKKDEVKNIEKNMYGNVIALMTVFIGIFSLINVNVSQALSQTVDLKTLLVFNLSTAGSVSFMAALIHTFLSFEKSWKWVIMWIITALTFAGAAAVYVFLK